MPVAGPPVFLVRKAPGQHIANASRFNATLIADRRDESNVKLIVDLLKKKGLEKYL